MWELAKTVLRERYDTVSKIFRTSNIVLHISMAGYMYLKSLKTCTGRIHTKFMIVVTFENDWKGIRLLVGVGIVYLLHL